MMWRGRDGCLTNRLGHTWDSFFIDSPSVADDFLTVTVVELAHTGLATHAVVCRLERGIRAQCGEIRVRGQRWSEPLRTHLRA